MKLVNNLLSAFFLVLLANSAFSQSVPSQAFQFITEKVGDNIYTIRPEKYWRVNSTSIVFVGRQSLILVDGQTDENMSTQMLDFIQAKISSLPIEYVLITHPHFDHIGGLKSIKNRFPSVKLIGHKNVEHYIRTHIQEERQLELDAWLLPLLEAKKKQIATAKNKQQKKELETARDQLAQYTKDIAESEIMGLDIYFDNELSLTFEGKKIQLKHVASAHTEADSIIAFPDSKALVTGDLFQNLEPFFSETTNVQGWLSFLDQIIAMDVDVYLGGHGEPIRDKDLLKFWRNYIEELYQIAKASKLAGESLESTQKRINVKNIKAFQGNHYNQRIDFWFAKIMAFDDSMEAKLDRELAALWPHA